MGRKTENEDKDLRKETLYTLSRFNFLNWWLRSLLISYGLTFMSPSRQRRYTHPVSCK